MTHLFSSAASRGHRADARAWIEANPRGFALFEELALRKAERGEPFGVKALAEAVRWEHSIERHGEFKINNNHVAWIAEALVEKHPHLKRFIRQRKRSGAHAQKGAA